MADSIFTKIIKGAIPCHKIYEDDRTLAFLDIHPKADGHILVVPKKQIDEFQNLPDEDYIALMKTVKKVAHRLKEVFKADRIGLQVIGVDVPHAHIHIFPFSNMVDYRRPQNMNTEPDHGRLAEIAKRLAF